MTIIPLAPASRPGSSDLPEGSSFHAVCTTHKGACSFERAQRAGPALPSYLVLHHAGFAVPASLLTPRWALTPPFHPYLRRVPSKDIPKVFLRAITGIRSAGGIFSVALSVTRSLRTASPGVTRRVAQSCSCGSQPKPRTALTGGVRTFLPSSPVAAGLSRRQRKNQRSSSSPANFIISCNRLAPHVTSQRYSKGIASVQ